MEFDKSKIYTAANADELKVGSRVIVADTLKDLKNKVEMGGYVTKLLSIETDDVEYRFCIDGGLGDSMYALAYLVEEPVKLKWTDLEIGDIITGGSKKYMVTGINSEADDFHVCASGNWFSDEMIEYWKKVEKDI